MSSFKNKVSLAKESLKAIATNVINGEEVMVEPKIVEERNSICDGCPQLKKLGLMRICGECGCTLNVKAKLADMKCPLNKW